MKAAVYYGPGDIRYEEVETPKPGKKGALVRVKACGICSIIDVAHYLKSFPLLDMPHVKTEMPSPAKIILGHEYSGEVCEVGSEVTSCKKGDRIYSVIWDPCGICDDCRSGHEEKCTLSDVGGRRVNGAMAEYLLLPNVTYPFVTDDKLIKLPENITFKDGAMLEVMRLGLGMAAKAKNGDTVVVFGQDILGLTAVYSLKQRGLKVIAADVSKMRLKASKILGADVVVDLLNEDVFKIVHEFTKGKLADVVLESSGRPANFYNAIDVTKPFGDVWFGTFYTAGPFYDPTWSNSPTYASNITQKPGLSLHCSWGTLGPWMPRLQEAVNIIQSGKITADKYVTHTLPLSKVKEAFEIATNPHESIKVILEP